MMFKKYKNYLQILLFVFIFIFPNLCYASNADADVDTFIDTYNRDAKEDYDHLIVKKAYSKSDLHYYLTVDSGIMLKISSSASCVETDIPMAKMLEFHPVFLHSFVALGYSDKLEVANALNRHMPNQFPGSANWIMIDKQSKKKYESFIYFKDATTFYPSLHMTIIVHSE